MRQLLEEGATPLTMPLGSKKRFWCGQRDNIVDSYTNGRDKWMQRELW